MAYYTVTRPGQRCSLAGCMRGLCSIWSLYSAFTVRWGGEGGNVKGSGGGTGGYRTVGISYAGNIDTARTSSGKNKDKYWLQKCRGVYN